MAQENGPKNILLYWVEIFEMLEILISSITLVNVYVDLLVFTHIAGTS